MRRSIWVALVLVIAVAVGAVALVVFGDRLESDSSGEARSIPAESSDGEAANTASESQDSADLNSGEQPELNTSTSESAESTIGVPRHYTFDEDTILTSTFTLRPGDTVEIRNGACVCFGPGGRADWQGTETDTWSDDGREQNLARDIEIFGDGHIRFEHGSQPSVLRYVAINLRPPVEVGKYPLHFHHLGDGARGTVVEGVVVTDSPNRAFVVHASHGITLKDTIAKNIAGSAYWWDSPEFQDDDQSDNSNDVTYDHALADGVTPLPGDTGHRLAAFTLGSGTGNAVVDSVAMNVAGGKDSSGFMWPERHHQQPQTWRFVNNTAHDNSANGIFVWQNNDQEHIVSGFRGYANGSSDIDHGAYSNRYDYRDVDVDRVEVHALGWSIDGGTIGAVSVHSHTLEGGPVRFSNVTVDQVVLDNAGNGGELAGHYIFTQTGLTFADVRVESVVAGTKVTIDGETSSY